MALWIAGITVELREVKLSDKPPELAEASPKATVPVLVRPDETIDESMAIMRWALAQSDPENWLAGNDNQLIDRFDSEFKYHLDRYKYPNRYEHEHTRVDHRASGLAMLRDLDQRLATQKQLCGDHRTLADIALFPFIRQFANTDRAWFDGQTIPHLHFWLTRHLKSDLFAAVMPKFAQWSAGDPPVLFGPDVTAMR